MRQALLVGVISFAVLVAGVSPSHFWLDSGELTAAGFELGVMHPPGSPGFGLLLRLAAFIPLGSIGFRLGVVCAACGAAVVALVFHILRRRGTETWVAACASAWVLLGWTFTRQSRVVEIYTFAALLLLVALWGFDELDEDAPHPGRQLIGLFAAVWGAWCFGDLRLAFVPLFVLGWVLGLRSSRPWARWAPAVVALASCVVLTLPLSSARMPLMDWGDPDDLADLIDHVFAASIRGAYDEEILPRSLGMWQVNATALFEQLAQDLGPVGPAGGLAALIGLWLPWRSPRSRRVAAVLSWLVAVELFYAIGINPMGIRDRQTGLVLAPLFALAVAEQMRRAFADAPQWRFAVGPILWGVLVVPAAMTSARDLAQTRSWMPHAWTRAVLEQVPLGGGLIMQSDDLAAGVAYARIVEGARPDIIPIVAQHLHKPVPDAVADDPRVGPLLRLGLRAPDDEAARIVAVLDEIPRGVAVEYPAATVLKRVGFWSRYGWPPVRVQPGMAGLESPHPDVFVEQWMPSLRGDEDEQRLATALANDARARIRVERDIKTAIEALEWATRIRPEQASAWVTLGALHDRRGDSQRAIAMTRRALEIEPSRSAALTNLALYLSRDPATHAEALDLARRAVALRPWRADVRARLEQIEQHVAAR